jgi:nucleoside-diphosphate-sugar epimerase
VKGHILVTGGTGFIGAALIRVLRVAGYKVTSVSRSRTIANDHFTLDLANKDSVANFVRNLDSVTTVIHCAAIAHGENPPNNYSVSDFNTLILENLLSSFGHLQPHWIFLSSVSVYGVGYEQNPVQIVVLPETTDDYGSGKLRDEQRLLSKCDNLDILRLMPTYDPDHMADVKKRIFFPKTNIKFRIFPSPSYGLCNVSIVGDAVLKCLNSIPGRRLHQVGDVSLISQRDLLEKFPGFAIALPQLLIKICIKLIPLNLKLGYGVRLLLKKLALPNVYEVGIRELPKR